MVVSLSAFYFYPAAIFFNLQTANISVVDNCFDPGNCMRINKFKYLLPRKRRTISKAKRNGFSRSFYGLSASDLARCHPITLTKKRVESAYAAKTCTESHINH